MLLNLEIFLGGKWQAAGTIESVGEPALGATGKARFCYDLAYAAENIERRESALSCLFPVDFGWETDKDRWPAFMLDILPTGAARRHWLSQLGTELPEDQRSDWQLLRIGGGNPIGNLRIKEALVPDTNDPGVAHAGFEYAEVIGRGEEFIAYARAHGAPVSGSTGAQGDAPKFLLVEDRNGRWHADNTLPDANIKQHWLVKFPRGKQQSDRLILRTEAAYYQVAEEIGIDTGSHLRFENNALFIPRFDRLISNDSVARHGVETLCSIADVRTFGRAVSQNRLVKALIEFSDSPQADVAEFVRRDMLNIAMGNTDNHGRNTALLKQNNNFRLAPLYDFAPMYLDDAGIARACRWDGEQGSRPDWLAIADDLARQNPIDGQVLLEDIASFADRMTALPGLMKKAGVDTQIIEDRTPYITSVIVAGSGQQKSTGKRQPR